MKSGDEKQDSEGFFAHLPAVLALLLVLTILISMWTKFSWSYLAWSSALAVPWLALLITSWKLRSELMTALVTVPVLFLLVVLSPGGWLSVAQGYLVSSCTAFALIWLGRHPLQKFLNQPATSKLQPNNE
jgi:hypothetical protein